MDPRGHSLETQLAVLGEQMREVREQQAEIISRLDGPPWERSMRGRLHALEAEAAASKASSAALAEAQRERRLARAERESAETNRLSLRWKAAGIVGAFALGLYPYVAHFAGWH